MKSVELPKDSTWEWKGSLDLPSKGNIFSFLLGNYHSCNKPDPTEISGSFAIGFANNSFHFSILHLGYSRLKTLGYETQVFFLLLGRVCIYLCHRLKMSWQSTVSINTFNDM